MSTRHAAIPAAVVLALGGLCVRASARQAPAPRAQAAAIAPERLAQPLPTHPEIIRGTLDNGLTFMIKKQANPAGKTYLNLHIASGSTNETDKQRGIAHYLEHMAFNGSDNFPPGTLIPAFEHMGLTFGRHQNASTNFDATNYILDLPGTDRDTVGKGLLFFSDVAGRLTLLDKEIDDERQIILEEKRARLSAEQRVFDQSLPRTLEGSLVAQRLPIGVEETILALKRQDFVDYYTKWYVPSNMTLMAVGDFEPEMVATLIREHFSGLKASPRPAPQNPGVKTATAQRAFVVTDPELTRASVQVMVIGLRDKPSTTVGGLRDDLLDQIGTWAFNRRVRAKVDAGAVKFRGGNASVNDDYLSAARMASADALGEPADWKAMLTDIVREVVRARAFGFTEREVDDARRELLNQAQNFAKRESTMPSPMVARMMVRAVNRGEPVMSAAQRADLLAELLPTISAEAVSARFKQDFDTDRAALAVALPSSGGAPSDAEALAALKEALQTTVSAEAESDRPNSLMAKAPDAGKTLTMAIHPASKVLSARLENGGVVHHRFMDERKNSVTVTVTLAGGQIEETAATRGFTQAAAVAFSRPATRSLSATNIRDIMTGKDARVIGNAGRDAVTLAISGSPSDLEAGLQLAHLLLREPRIEPAAFEQWKQGQLQAIAARKTQPQGVMTEIVADALYPKDEPRARPLTAEEVQRMTIGPVQAWLDSLIARAPMEISIVGDIEKTQAMDLALRYFGSLPKRDDMNEKTLDNRRAIVRTPGPILRDVELETRTPQAFVYSGFYGVDGENVRDVRIMGMAAQIMSTRMIRQVREEAQLVYSISTRSSPAEAYPGFGLFYAASPTDPQKAPALSRKIPEMFAEFAKDGPTEDEVAVARTQVLTTLEEQMREPGFWNSTLSDLAYRNRNLDDVVNARVYIESMTPALILECFRKYAKPDAMVTFIVRPKAPAGEPAPR